ncbi:tripartite tricarboxylate transporter permease [Acrocarpospora sp. B8E8]
MATVVLAVAAPPLARVALQFGPAEYFSLVVLGLVVSIALARGTALKALAMIALGVLFGAVGQDIYTGTPRFVFDQRELYGGIDFVSVAVGMFGVAEILRPEVAVPATSSAFHPVPSGLASTWTRSANARRPSCTDLGWRYGDFHAR